jgi:uncharacterized phiE125 gp8 family phage protein
MALSLITAPAAEPVTVAVALDHLRLPPNAPDAAVVARLIAPAREYAESQTARQFVTATWQLTLDRFPPHRAPITLPLPPLQSVTEVTYLDESGTLQTWAAGAYVVNAPRGPRALEGRLYPALDVDYPVTAWREDAVTVRFVAGYGDAADVPQAITQAMLLLLGEWYENRESVVVGSSFSASVAPLPFAVEALLAPFLLFSGAIR